MKNSLSFLLILIFSLFFVSCNKKVVLKHYVLTLRPDAVVGKDAMITSLAPNTNYGTHTDFAAIATTNSGTPATARSLIRFDFSNVPLNAIIDSVRLSLFGYISPANGGHQTLSGNNVSALRRVIERWDESNVTWNNQPASTDIDQVILPMSVYETQNYLKIDLTKSATYMIKNPTKNYGYIFELLVESYYRRMVFASTDNPNAALRPKIEIYFSLKKPIYN